MKTKQLSVTCAVFGLFAVILTIFSETASTAASEGLNMCIRCVIPSLFPFTVASTMLVKCGASEAFSKFLPLAKIYRLPANASGAIILGVLCGFPIGAKASVDLYRQGIVTKEQAQVLISVANNTGPSFVVAVIGTAFWKSTAFGWCLYFFQIISSLTAGLLVNNIFMPVKYKAAQKPLQKEKCDTPAKIFTSSVSESVNAVLGVTGFIMFFSVVSAYVRLITDSLDPLIGTGILSILELTGASKASAVSAQHIGIAAAGFFQGFALGFSGLSVFCQAASFSAPEGLSLSRTAIVKLLQGTFCGILSAIAAPRISYVTAFSTISTPCVPAYVSTAFFCLLTCKYTVQAKARPTSRRKKYGMSQI